MNTDQNTPIIIDDEDVPISSTPMDVTNDEVGDEPTEIEPPIIIDAEDVLITSTPMEVTKEKVVDVPTEIEKKIYESNGTLEKWTEQLTLLRDNGYKMHRHSFGDASYAIMGLVGRDRQIIFNLNNVEQCHQANILKYITSNDTVFNINGFNDYPWSTPGDEAKNNIVRAQNDVKVKKIEEAEKTLQELAVKLDINTLERRAESRIGVTPTSDDMLDITDDPRSTEEIESLLKSTRKRKQEEVTTEVESLLAGDQAEKKQKVTSVLDGDKQSKFTKSVLGQSGKYHHNGFLDPVEQYDELEKFIPALDSFVARWKAGSLDKNEIKQAAKTIQSVFSILHRLSREMYYEYTKIHDEHTKLPDKFKGSLHAFTEGTKLPMGCTWLTTESWRHCLHGVEEHKFKELLKENFDDVAYKALMTSFTTILSVESAVKVYKAAAMQMWSRPASSANQPTAEQKLIYRIFIALSYRSMVVNYSHVIQEMFADVESGVNYSFLDETNGMAMAIGLAQPAVTLWDVVYSDYEELVKGEAAIETTSSQFVGQQDPHRARYHHINKQFSWEARLMNTQVPATRTISELCSVVFRHTGYGTRLNFEYPVGELSVAHSFNIQSGNEVTAFKQWLQGWIDGYSHTNAAAPSSSSSSSSSRPRPSRAKPAPPKLDTNVDNMMCMLTLMLRSHETITATRK